MPGSERTASSISIARLMESQGLSEDELLAPRPEEIPRIRNGNVTLLPVEDKQRVLDLLQEVLRFRIDVGYIVSTLGGDSYVRMKRALGLGEDFIYFSTQPTEHMSTSPVAFLLQRLAKYLEVRFALDLRPADLNLEIPGGELIPNGYTLLDLVFVAATSNQRRDNFAENYKILRVTLEYTPRVVSLGLIGQDLL